MIESVQGDGGWGATSAPARRRSAPSLGELLGYIALAVVVGLWAWRAFSDRSAYDGGLAYVGGQIAWATGHPEQWFSWTGTPFLAGVMAVVSRIMSSRTMAEALTALNVVLVLATAGVALRRLRGVLSPLWWWVAAAALLTFPPIMSSVWWKQFNIISLVLTLAGFDLIRRNRAHSGGALLGLSLAIKPLAILLPFVLLARRTTRRAGAWALGYLIVLDAAAQALTAAHAGGTGALNPLLALRNFADKAKPAAGLACSPDNFAPQAMLCRLAGVQHITIQRIVVYIGVAILGACVVGALRGRDARSWELFAFTVALSTMVSPIAWSHYQVMLAPLFVLLLARFSREGAELGLWAMLAASFVLAVLVWSPYGTLIEAVRFQLHSHFVFNQHPWLTAVAQFSQYALIFAGVIWYTAARYRREGGLEEAPVAPAD